MPKTKYRISVQWVTVERGGKRWNSGMMMILMYHHRPVVLEPPMGIGSC
jgi:hypothetical protein